MTDNSIEPASPIPYTLLPSSSKKEATTKPYLPFLSFQVQADGARGTTSFALVVVALWGLAAAVGLGSVVWNLFAAFGPALVPFAVITIYMFSYYRQFNLNGSLAASTCGMAVGLALVNLIIQNLAGKFLDMLLEDLLGPWAVAHSTKEKIIVIAHIVLTAVLCTALDMCALTFMAKYAAFSPLLQHPQAVMFYTMLASNIMALMHNTLGFSFHRGVPPYLLNLCSMLLMGFCMALGFGNMRFGFGGEAKNVFLTVVAPVVVRLLVSVASELFGKWELLFGRKHPLDM